MFPWLKPRAIFDNRIFVVLVALMNYENEFLCHGRIKIRPYNILRSSGTLYKMPSNNHNIVISTEGRNHTRNFAKIGDSCTAGRSLPTSHTLLYSVTIIFFILCRLLEWVRSRETSHSKREHFVERGKYHIMFNCLRISLLNLLRGNL